MSSKSKNKSDKNFMLRLANLIVDKRNLIFFLYIMLVIFSAFSQGWVKVEDDLTAYLPPDSVTRKGLDVMTEQFVTFGTDQVMVDSITYNEAKRLADEIAAMDGVQSVVFDDTADHYCQLAALYSVTYDYDESDGRCLEAHEAVLDALSAYDLYYTSSFENTTEEIITSEMNKIVVYVAVVVVLVLILTSQTYAEVPVLLLTFVSAAIVNMGTNFLLGTISFVSNSVTIVLQLALSVDYAVIFCNRYKEEHQALPVRDAVVVALSKAIPEICASSLTTIGGLAAMMFMQFKIGPDMGVCLIKAILLSLLSVFLLMPGLLVLFGKWMDKTVHKNFVPKIPFVGRFDYKTRFAIPPLFVLLIIAGYFFSAKCPYVYGYGSLTTPQLNDTQIAAQKIEDTFGSDNMVALVVPAGSYAKESRLLAELEGYDEVSSSLGLSNTEAMNGYMLTDKLTPRQFSELIDMDYELAELVYTAYAADKEDYGKIVGGISSYGVPLMDMFFFVYEEVQEGYVTLDDDLMETLEDAYSQMSNGKKQLQGENYSRALIYLTLPTSGNETYAFLDTIEKTARKYYPEGDVYVVGDSSSEYDFQKTFSTDNIIISIVSIIIVLAVLLFTFNSVGMPLLLILVIQGCIWINFSIPYLQNQGVFFMSYLVVSSVQMGANIDYAIVISSRYMELKDKMAKEDAIIETLNFAFPTIITSGSMMALASVLIGNLTSEAAIAGIGQSLGRGTIISILIVMFVLPQLLLLGEKLIDRTSFAISTPLKRGSWKGTTRIDGFVSGEISGKIYGVVNVVVDGDVNVNLIYGNAINDESARQATGYLEEKNTDTEMKEENGTDAANTDAANTDAAKGKDLNTANTDAPNE